jgi:hypothetical protein
MCGENVTDTPHAIAEKFSIFGNDVEAKNYGEGKNKYILYCRLTAGLKG